MTRRLAQRQPLLPWGAPKGQVAQLFVEECVCESGADQGSVGFIRTGLKVVLPLAAAFILPWGFLQRQGRVSVPPLSRMGCTGRFLCLLWPLRPGMAWFGVSSPVGFCHVL